MYEGTAHNCFWKNGTELFLEERHRTVSGGIAQNCFWKNGTKLFTSSVKESVSQFSLLLLVVVCPALVVDVPEGRP